MTQNATMWRTAYMPLIIGGIGAMASALLMPWLTVVSPAVGQITRTGLQLRDGRLFVLALIILALVARSEARTPRPVTRTALLGGFLVLGVALAVEYRALTRLVTGLNAEFAQARLGFGFFAMGLGLTFSVAGVLKRRIAFQPGPAEDAADQFVR